MTDEQLIPNEHEEKLLPERFPDEAPARSSWGSVIGVVIILAMLLVSALYVWGAHVESIKQREAPPHVPQSATTTIIISTSSTSTAQ